VDEAAVCDRRVRWTESGRSGDSGDRYRLAGTDLAAESSVIPNVTPSAVGTRYQTYIALAIEPDHTATAR
jgi:hypothetical protein